MEMKQILVLIGNKPERLQALVKVLESNKINIHAIFEGYEAFGGFVHVVTPEPDQAMQALLEAGFAIFRPGIHESPVLRYNHAKAVAVCA
jgi:hypothetical protein